MDQEELEFPSKAGRTMIDLSQVSGIRKYIADYSSLESDYIFSRLTPQSTTSPLVSGPLRINGMLFCFVAKGYMNVDINLESYTVQANSFITATSANIITIREFDRKELDAYVLIIAPEFMRDINLDINVIQSSPIPRNARPMLMLTPQESELLQLYLELLHLNTKKNQSDLYIRAISRTLMSSIVYQLMQFAAMREDPAVTARSHSLTRRTNYVHDFMELVHRHHKHERSVAFYAEKLYITPKYLSLIVKESTGRSAAEWIDEFVILEAKNMLRFSRKNIQQIAYELNFANQSSFGKYFKNLTGMSPSAYQRS